MRLYEIQIDLMAGRRVNLLISATDAKWAMSEAIGLMHSMSQFEGEDFDADIRCSEVEFASVHSVYA